MTGSEPTWRGDRRHEKAGTRSRRMQQRLTLGSTSERTVALSLALPGRW